LALYYKEITIVVTIVKLNNTLESSIGILEVSLL